MNAGAAVGLTKGYRQKGVFAPGGSVVYIASVMGVVGMPGQVEYACTKGALVALRRVAAVELARRGSASTASPRRGNPDGEKFNASLSQEQLDARRCTRRGSDCRGTWHTPPPSWSPTPPAGSPGPRWSSTGGTRRFKCRKGRR